MLIMGFVVCIWFSLALGEATNANGVGWNFFVFGMY